MLALLHGVYIGGCISDVKRFLKNKAKPSKHKMFWATP